MESNTTTPNSKAKPAKDTTKETGLSQAQIRLLSLAWQCLKDGSEPQIDFAKLQPLSGYATVASVRTRWSETMKKLKEIAAQASNNDSAATASGTTAEGGAATAGNEDGAGPATAATPVKAKNGRKRNAAADPEAGEDGEGKVTPKKARTPRKKKTAADEDNGDEDPEAKKTPTKTPAKGAVNKGKGKATTTPKGKAAVAKNDDVAAAGTIEVKDEEGNDTVLPTIEKEDDMDVDEVDANGGGKDEEAAPAVAW